MCDFFCFDRCKTIYALRYWTLPGGQVVQWSLLDLVSKRQDELIIGDKADAYLALGAELSYEALGMLSDNESET